MVESPATGMHSLAYSRHERTGSRFTLINTIELSLGATLLGMILFTVLWQAVTRYFPEFIWIGAGEVARYSLVALTFVLVGHLFGSGQHITITILDSRLNWMGLALLKALAAVIVTVIAFAFILGAIALLMDPFTWTRVTSVMRVPEGFIVLIPLLGFSLMVLRGIESVVTQILALRKGE
jgi:TRAP-type C4-dicarboxylate transport system permease small subunit